MLCSICSACQHSRLANVQSVEKATGRVTCNYNAFKITGSDAAQCSQTGNGYWVWAGACTGKYTTSCRLLKFVNLYDDEDCGRVSKGVHHDQCSDAPAM